MTTTPIPKKQPDIREDLMTREEWEKNCELYADYAFATPPDKFLFYHYDEDPKNVLVCHRPMVGIEKYVVEGIKGGFYGTYDTRDIMYYLKSGTWIEVESAEFFRQAEIASLERRLQQLKDEGN
jgi:hypothetical protein